MYNSECVVRLTPWTSILLFSPAYDSVSREQVLFFPRRSVLLVCSYHIWHTEASFNIKHLYCVFCGTSNGQYGLLHDPV